MLSLYASHTSLFPPYFFLTSLSLPTVSSGGESEKQSVELQPVEYGGLLCLVLVAVVFCGVYVWE